MYDDKTNGVIGLGGTNGSGQVPALDISNLIDADTPQNAMKWTSGYDKSSYHLVFSDEFEVDEGLFWPAMIHSGRPSISGTLVLVTTNGTLPKLSTPLVVPW